MILDKRKEIFRRSLESGLLYVICFFLSFYSLVLLFIPPGEREKKMGREWKGANLWEMGGGLGVYGLGKCDECMGGGEGI